MLVKICGITSPEAAIACLEAGADMIGLVYYPPSSRHVDETKIGEILDATEHLRNKTRRIVLVAVNSLPKKTDDRIDYIQSYGTLVKKFPKPIIPVITDRERCETLISQPVEVAEVPFYTLEISRGILPGGNGTAWDWSLAKPFCERYPTLLAGGITLENVLDAIGKADPYGIDVSSGVESAPGIKDIGKVRCLIEKVRNYQRQQDFTK